jgi:hypothetical protein
MLIVTKKEDEYYFGLISTNKSINPNVEDLIVFHYKLKEQNGNVSCNDEWHRNLLLSSISHIYTEAELRT